MSDLAFRFACASGGEFDWRLRRNCSVTPVQLAWFYGSICLVSTVIAVLCWHLGAKLVMVFTGIELLVVGVAFVVFARHATDGERILLKEGRLLVELEQAGRLVRTEFRSDWVRVEPKGGHRSLIEVSGQGRRVEVGRFVRPELRPVLASEIRRALRTL